MKRRELLEIAKPILFNTPMVQSILADIKGATRRPIKLKYSNTHIKIRKDKYGETVIEIQNNVEGETYGKTPDGKHFQKLLAYIEKKPPYKVGDILYVRETWAAWSRTEGTMPQIYYRADYDVDWNAGDDCGEIMSDFPWCIKWKPSIHMPKEAARIFLKVTDVRVERLQDMTREDAIKEGAETDEYLEMEEVAGITGVQCQTLRDYFGRVIWDNTIKKADYDKYSWDANPWVWVIEFERIEIDE